MVDVDKRLRAVVSDATGRVSKVVDLVDRQVGASSDPKNLILTGKFLTPGGDYITVGAGINASIQSDGQVYLNTARVGTPADVGGCQVWCESALQNVQLDSTGVTPKVTKWIDLSGNGNHLAQTLSSAQPTWTASNSTFKDMNGNSLPSIDFAGAQVLTAPAVTLSTFTVICVVQIKSSLTIVYEHSAGATALDGSFIFTSNNASGGPAILARRGGLISSKDMPAGAAWAISNGNPVVLTQTFNGTQITHRMAYGNWDVQGTTDVTSNTLSTSLAVTTGLNVGGRQNTTIGLIGSFVAFAAFSPVLTSGQAARVARYFGDKYGVVAL